MSWSSMFSSTCSRFGRMDPLSKLGLMAVELLDPGFADMTDEQKTDIGVCMISPCGSLSTDIEFLREISPSIFIYTLPSSVIGEVCIRHRLRGPLLCLMSEENTERSIVDEASERIAMGEATSMLCLSCDAGSPDAQNAVNFALDKDNDFCWYVYALYLVRKDMVHDTGKAIAPGADIRQTCLSLCENK